MLLPRALFPLLLFAAACPQHKPVAPTAPPALAGLEGTWLNLHEENRGDTLVYRPNTYRFPPARGRTGFRIGPYGRFVQYDIAPTDGLEGRPGNWTAAPTGTALRIHLIDNQQPDYTLEILSLDHGVMTLVRH